MKKTYKKPAIEQVLIAPTLLSSTSINVDNNPTNDMTGDVKESGDWDIWGDQAD